MFVLHFLVRLLSFQKETMFVCQFLAELGSVGTRQLLSFATTTTRQRNRASRTSQGPEKIRKIVRPQCLDGVATTTIVKWQLQTTLCPEK